MESQNFKILNNEEKETTDLNHKHDGLEVAEEEIVYCEDDYDESQPDVPCYVMNNSFYSPVNMNAINSDHSKCHICGEDLTNRRFYNHLFDQHGFTKQQCEMLKQQKKLEASKNRQGSNSRKIIKLHACGSCGLEYITKSGLTSHLAKSPSCSMQEEIVESSRGGTGASYNIVCPSYGCDKNVATYLDLAIHVDTEHRDLTTVADSYRIRRVTFRDRAGFMRWKKSMEKETSSEFFLRTSQKVSFAVRTILYKCVFSNSRGHPKGKRCEQCPAFIKCCERNHGQFEVVACFGHLGHEHPTETSIAREIRLEKYRQIDTMEAHNIQHRPLMSTHKRHVYVDEYGRPTEGVMIVMEEGSEDVTVDNQDEYSNVIVEEGEPELLEGQKTSGRQVYIEQPGPSHYQ